MEGSIMTTATNVLSALIAYIQLEECNQLRVLITAKNGLDAAKNNASRKDTVKVLSAVVDKAFGKARGPGFKEKDFKAVEEVIQLAVLHAELRVTVTLCALLGEDHAKSVLELAELAGAEAEKDEKKEAARIKAVDEKTEKVKEALGLVATNEAEKERIEAEIAALEAKRAEEAQDKAGDTPEKAKDNVDNNTEKLVVKIGEVTLVPSDTPKACTTIGEAAVAAGYITSFRGKGYETLVAHVQKGYNVWFLNLRTETANTFITSVFEEETPTGRERVAGGTVKERMADMNLDFDATVASVRREVLSELDLTGEGWGKGTVQSKVSNIVTRLCNVKKDAVLKVVKALETDAVNRFNAIVADHLGRIQQTPAMKKKYGTGRVKKTAYKRLRDYARGTKATAGIRGLYTKRPSRETGYSYLSTPEEIKAAMEKALGKDVEAFRKQVVVTYKGQWLSAEQVANSRVDEAVEQVAKPAADTPPEQPAEQAGEGVQMTEGDKPAPKPTVLADPQPEFVTPLEMMREAYFTAGQSFFGALASFATSPVREEILAWNPEKGEPSKDARDHITAILADEEKAAEVMSHMPVPEMNAEEEDDGVERERQDALAGDEQFERLGDDNQPEGEEEQSGSDSDEGDEGGDKPSTEEDAVKASNDKKTTAGGVCAQAARLDINVREAYANMGPVLRKQHTRLKDIATAIVTQVEGMEKKDFRIWHEDKVPTNALGAFTKPAGWIASWWKECQHEAVDNEKLNATELMVARLTEAFLENADTKLAAFTLLLGLQAHVARRVGTDNIFFEDGFKYHERMVTGLEEKEAKALKVVLESKDPNKAALKLSADLGATERRVLRLQATNAQRVLDKKRPMDIEKDEKALDFIRTTWRRVNALRDHSKYTADRGLACEGLKATVYKDSEGNKHPLFPKSLATEGPKMLLDALDLVFEQLSPAERHVVFAARFCAAKQLKHAGSPGAFSRGVYHTFDLVRAGLNLIWQPIRWVLHIPEIALRATLGGGFHAIRRLVTKEENMGNLITVGEYYEQVWETCKVFGYSKPKALLQLLWNGTFGRIDGWEWSDDETKAKKAADRRSLAEVWASMKSNVAPNDADGNTKKAIKAVGRGATNSLDWATENKVNLGLGVAASVATAVIFAPGALIVAGVGVGTTALVVGARALWRKFRGTESGTTVNITSADVQGGVSAGVPTPAAA